MGMTLTHGVASGMGGIRTAGDLVARMQLSQKMRIQEAKDYVADKLKVSVKDLSDPVIMREVREDLDIGCVLSVPGLAKGIAAKARIADLLEIPIASVEIHRSKLGVATPAASPTRSG
jgi:dimethylamine--corrinoid protein Co-methyltransferase